MSGMDLTNSVKLKVAQLVMYRVFLHDINSLKIYNATILFFSGYSVRKSYFCLIFIIWLFSGRSLKNLVLFLVVVKVTMPPLPETQPLSHCSSVKE